MKKLCSLFAILFWCALMQKALAQDEFNGPYPSWANLKTRFGAKGDGIADDTKAIQKSLDSLSLVAKNFNAGKSAYAVIYLPKGRYRISQTLRLRGKIGISIIGEDPANTSIEWAGAAKDTMLWCNGASYFKISRITWNAMDKDSITGIGIHWTEQWNTENSQSFAPLNIEISDCVFTGKFYFGIHGGRHGGGNDSEVAIQRCVFKSCMQAGIAIRGYNALDYWIWDCKFIACYRAVENEHGNYHLYRCYFQDTKNWVMTNTNGNYTSARNCYSINADEFSHDHNSGCNPFKRVFENNYIGKTKSPTVEYYHMGRISYFNNRIETTLDVKNPFNLIYSSWCAGGYLVMSVSNQYELRKPWNVIPVNKTIYTVDDKFSVSDKRTAAAFINSMPATPPFKGRKIFEVPANAGTTEIQEIITAASRLNGQRPVVHFGFGSYVLDNSLIIPAEADMQITGDGLLYASTILLSAKFPKNKPAIIVKGPTHIVIRDIYIDQSIGNREDFEGIVFENVDQEGSSAFIDQLNTAASHAIVLDNTDFLFVQSMNSFFSAGNMVKGGPLSGKGKGQSVLYCFGAQFAGATVTNKGRMVAKDCWWEGDMRKPIDLQGDGNITIDGGMTAPRNADSLPTIFIKNFSGKVTLMNMYVAGGIQVAEPSPNLDLLVWNLNFYWKINLLDFITSKAAYKAAFLGCTTQCFDTSKQVCFNTITHNDRFVNVKDTSNFILSHVKDDIAAIPKTYSTSSGSKISNIFISRVSLGKFNHSIVLQK